MAALYAGLPEDVRALVMVLYERAKARYDSAHGLCAGSDFDTCNQGSIASPGRARLLMNSLAEAISLVCDGFRCWAASRRVAQLIYADDLLGLFGGWGSARIFVRVVCDWCEVMGHRMGVSGIDKLAAGGVMRVGPGTKPKVLRNPCPGHGRRWVHGCGDGGGDGGGGAGLGGGSFTL